MTSSDSDTTVRLVVQATVTLQLGIQSGLGGLLAQTQAKLDYQLPAVFEPGAIGPDDVDLLRITLTTHDKIGSIEIEPHQIEEIEPILMRAFGADFWEKFLRLLARDANRRDIEPWSQQPQ